MREGNCYATSEALYHLLGGKEAGWKPVRLRIPGDTKCHWYLEHNSGLRLDATASQFDFVPDYSQGVGCGFLTKEPSRRAREMMETMVYAS